MADNLFLQYLCEGLEDDILGRQLGWGLHKTIDKETELRNMIETSGKMVLLHKLLPKLKSEGRKVSLTINMSSLRFTASKSIALYHMLDI